MPSRTITGGSTCSEQSGEDDPTATVSRFAPLGIHLYFGGTPTTHNFAQLVSAPSSGIGLNMEPCRVWVEQCDAARRIEDDFGTDKALDYLIREKFLNFLEAAETDDSFRAEIP